MAVRTDDNETPSVEQTLPVERLRGALAPWGLDDAAIEPMEPGATAEVYRVTRGSDQCVAKFIYSDRPYAEAGLRVSTSSPNGPTSARQHRGAPTTVASSS